jgi:hypothetical protein
MGQLFHAVILALFFSFVIGSPGFADDYPQIPGVYLKLIDGTYKWLPPVSHKDDDYRGSRIADLGREPRHSSHRLRPAKISIGDILLAPTIDLSEIDHIVINAADEKLRFLFSVAFADEYTPAGEGGGTLIVTKWGFSSEKFDTEYSENGSRAYRAKNRGNYFSSFTYPQAGANQGKIIDVGRALATDSGLYLFNTSGSLSNLLWNIRLHRRQADIPETVDLLRKLEQTASSYNEWGTVAWTYKDFGNTSKAVEIYRDKVIPQTASLKENERQVWLQYFEEIKK